MTVYSINQRVFEQTSTSSSGNKTGSSAADQFLAALSQAGSQVSAGASAAPSAEQALKKVFDRQSDTARPAEKVAEKPRRTETKTSERKETATDGREAPAVDEPEAKPQVKEQAASQQDGGEAPASDGETAAETIVQDGQTQVVVQDAAAPAAETVATVMPVQQQVAETVADGGETNSVQVVEAVDPENIAEDAAAPRQTQAQAGDVVVAGEDGDAEAFDPAAIAQQATKAKSGQHHADRNAAAQAQADDLAASLDDTGARLSVQVKVAETAKPVQPSVGTAEVLLTQDVDGLEMPLSNQPNGNPAGGQGQANAGQAGQAGANPAQDPALINRPVDAKPFVAALAAAQTEAVSQPQAAGTSGNQTQAVAGLNGAGGTQAAAKTAQAQAAQAPRPQQMPQAKEVMDQVKVQIAKQGANGDVIKVQLKPVELGSIEVKLEVGKDGTVSGVVTADNKDTLNMLKNDSRTLEKALSDAGFKTDSGSLTFNLRGEGQQQTAQDQGLARRSRRAAIAAAGGLDATQAGMAAQAQGRFAGGRSGVDIQV